MERTSDGQGGRWLAPADAAHVLGVTDRTLRRRVAAGQYRAQRTGGRTRIFLPDTTRPEVVDIGDDSPDGQADTSDARADGPDALTQLLREQIDGRLQAEQAAAMWQERARNLEAENSRLQELLALPAHVEGPAHRRPWWQVWRRTQADGTGARRPAQD